MDQTETLNTRQNMGQTMGQTMGQSNIMKFIPKNIKNDKEELYYENMVLKKQMNVCRNNLQMLQTRHFTLQKMYQKQEKKMNGIEIERENQMEIEGDK